MWIILNNFELLEKLYIATWQFPFTKSDYFSARGATRYLCKHKATSVNFCSIESLPAEGQNWMEYPSAVDMNRFL